MNIVEKLGFSIQYFIVLSLCCVCVIIFMLGIELISIYSYNPLSDLMMLVVVILLGIYFRLLNWIIQKLFFNYDMKYYPKSITLPEKYEEILKTRLKMQSNTDVILLKEKEIYQNYLNLNCRFKKPSEDILLFLKDVYESPEIFNQLRQINEKDEMINKIISEALMKEILKRTNNGLDINFENPILIGVFDFFKALEYSKIAYELKSCEERELENAKNINNQFTSRNQNFASKFQMKIMDYLNQQKEKEKSVLDKLKVEKIPRFDRINWKELIKIKRDPNIKKEKLENDEERKLLTKFYEKLNIPPVCNNFMEKIIMFVNIGDDTEILENEKNQEIKNEPEEISDKEDDNKENDDVLEEKKEIKSNEKSNDNEIFSKNDKREEIIEMKEISEEKKKSNNTKEKKKKKKSITKTGKLGLSSMDIYED